MRWSSLLARRLFRGDCLWRLPKHLPVAASALACELYGTAISMWVRRQGFARLYGRVRNATALLHALIAVVVAASAGTPAFADINNWRTGQVIPGTEGIVPAPSLQLASYDGEWNTPEKNLQFADFRGTLDLFESDFSLSWLDDARFMNANLGQALFVESSLIGADFSNADLVDALFSGATLMGATFNYATLGGTDFSGANVTGAKFWDVTSRGFLRGQLEATASYQVRDLTAIELAYDDLRGWNFSEQNLTDANLSFTTLTGTNLNYARLPRANFGEAIVKGALLWDVTSRGFTRGQLESTASYQAKDLEAIELAYNDMSGWDFHEQNLTNANLSHTTLIGTNLNYSTLAGANFNEAIVKYAKFWDVTSRGFTRAQLESTASYKAKDLEGIELAFNDLRGWDFHEQNLTVAVFESADLTQANLSRANLTNASFTNATLTGANLNYATLTNASFKNATLTGANLNYATLTNASFKNATLIGANLNYATLTNANFSGAILNSAKMWGVTSRGFTQSQLEASGSYLNKDLQGIELPFNNLRGWNFQGQNLTNALLGISTLDGADFSGANLTNASLHGTTLAGANFAGAILNDVSLEDTTSRGFTRTQFESTASFQTKDLRGIRLWNNDLNGWDFSGQNLTDAELGGSKLAQANFSGANLTNASLNSSSLANADFTDANITGTNLRSATALGFTCAQFESTASFQTKQLQGVRLVHDNVAGWDFSDEDLSNADFGFATLAGADLSGAQVLGASFESTTARGFTREQLASTASYQAKDLRGISMLKNDLSGWDFRGQNLANAHLGSAKLAQTNLTGADLRGVLGLDLTGAIDRNTILPGGFVDGLGLAPTEQMVIRDDDGVDAPPPGRLPRDPISLTVEEHFTMAAGSSLQIVFDADPWDSVIGFEPGIAVRLGGTLDLLFATGVDVSAQNGRTIQLFDWTDVTPRGVFTIGGPHGWDTSELYTTGWVTLNVVGTQNHGGTYDITDLNNVRNNFGGTGLGDVDIDGDVDITDLNIVRNNFGGAGGNRPVPEPHTVVLLVVGMAGFALRRSRQEHTRSGD